MTPETLDSDWLAPLAESPPQEEGHRGVTGCQGQADLHQCAQCLWDINPSKGLRGSGGAGTHERGERGCVPALSQAWDQGPTA